jgi:hypothetical protein
MPPFGWVNTLKPYLPLLFSIIRGYPTVAAINPGSWHAAFLLKLSNPVGISSSLPVLRLIKRQIYSTTPVMFGAFARVGHKIGIGRHFIKLNGDRIRAVGIINFKTQATGF